MQTEKQLLEIKIQNLEEQDLEFQINNFKQEIDTNVRKINADIKMTNALRYDHESEEFIYDPGFGPAIYYSYEFGDNQSIYEVIATLKRNIHLHNLLKNFDYEFDEDTKIVLTTKYTSQANASMAVFTRKTTILILKS